MDSKFAIDNDGQSAIRMPLSFVGRLAKKERCTFTCEAYHGHPPGPIRTKAVA